MVKILKGSILTPFKKIIVYFLTKDCNFFSITLYGTPKHIY